MEQTLLKKSSYTNADAQTLQLLADFREGDVQAFSKLYNLHINYFSVMAVNLQPTPNC